MLEEIGIDDGFIEHKFKLWVDQKERTWSEAIKEDRNRYPFENVFDAEN